MKLKEKTTEKLKEEINMLKVLNIALIIVLGLSFLYYIYNENSGMLITVPIALSAIIPLNYSNIKKIKSELKSRK